VGWAHFHQDKCSHTFHHLFTLHPRGDREVVLPLTPSLHPVRLLFLFTFNLPGLWAQLWATARLAFLGKLWNEWSEAVVPAEDAGARRQARAWAWTILVFHAALISVSIVFQLWLLPVLVTFGMFIGMPMHAGLRDNVPDFRLCCRTITLDPFSRFIYWHMSLHAEHHMYAADMPKPRTLIQAWKEMRVTYRQQKTQPGYQLDTPLQPRGTGRT
jgi:fatty acid desaturase